jgi:putative nucleotidyltransferase with HDIG domain
MREPGRVFDDLPVLRESRDRVVERARAGAPLTELVLAIEGDLGLAVRVLRRANGGLRSNTKPSIAVAVRALGHDGLAELAASAPAHDLEDRRPRIESMRLHALAVHAIAERLASLTGAEDVELLLTAALLHDIGRLALPGEPAGHASAGTPEQRLAAERAATGTDHAQLGAELVRRWRLPEELAVVVGGHHDADAGPQAALLCLADMLAHFRQGTPVDVEAMAQAAEALGLERAALGTLLYDLSLPASAPRRTIEPSPLSARERQVLIGLAEGKVYKQIAADLGLQASTVRSHLHRIYTRLGAVDRAQAVLLARERGWL